MVTSDKINIRYGSLFPWPFQLIAVIVLIVGLSLVISRPVPAVGLILFSVLILSGSEGTEIDKAEKTYRDYKSFFFLKSGSKERYTGIEKIFINTSKSKQTVHTAHTNKSSIFENIEFNGFLKFDDGTKIQLLQKRKKEDLLRALNRIASFLNVPVEDNTSVGNQ